MTTLAVSPADVARPAEFSSTVAIFADLMPDEVLAARRLRELKRRVMIGLVGVLVMLLAWYAASGLATSSAKDDLASAQQQAGALRTQQSKYAPLVTAQTQATQISSSLRKLMVGDVNWTSMLSRIRAAAKGGVTVTAVDATIAPATSTAGLSVLNQSGRREIGMMTITGIAPDPDSIAAYVEALGRITGLAAPLPVSVNGPKRQLQYSISVIITSDALGGRFATTTPGGK